MWIVRLALRRPYTFVVMAVLMAVLGGIAIVTMPKDIFPDIDIPIVSVVWRYGGMSPQEMSERVVKIHERTMSSTVNDIEHMESTSYTGVGVIRVFFQPKASVDLAIAQISSFSETLLRGMPPGIFPPSILKYDAASVPILQLGVSSPTLGEDKLYDYCNSFIRVQLSSVAGATMPLPYGGKPRAVMVDLDPKAMYAQHLSATDVSNAIDAQSLILPAGTAKMGNREYLVQMNSSPTTVAAMNNMPVRTVNGATVYIKDVAQVRDGFGVQTNMVRVNGTPAALITVLKNGTASTLDVVREVKAALPHALAGLPKSLKISQIFDQSRFVRAAINDVLREGLIAGVLTGLMILLFLGSWRSTLIVSISIPLSILTSLIVLNALGQTINLMTLGGMALAVGILVDDATVEIENIHRNLGMKKPITRAILDGAQQIAVPAFVSTLAICIVFVPVLLLTGVARFLFTPLAMAVVFAMLTSYLLTRTLVPTMVHFLLREEAELYQQGEDGHAAEAEGLFWRMHHRFNHGFEWMRNHYRDSLVWSLDHRKTVLVLFGGFCCGSLLLLLVVGQDFFPYVDSGEMRMHVRAPEGTRLEETGRIFARIEDEIRRVIPPDEFEAVLDNIGLPSSSINLTFGDSPYVGSSDGELLISLNREKHRPTKEYERRLREDLNAKFPDETFFFEAANMTNQILNFGLPAPIDIEVIGRNENANYQLTKRIEREVARVPGAVDVGIRQEMRAPTVKVDVDRIKASQAGLTQRDVANSLLISLSSSGQVAPNQWLNPATGVSYDITVQTPQYRINSFDTLQDTPITSAGGGSTQLLRNLGTLSRTTTPAVVTHYDVQPVFDIYANVDQRDLGGVARDVERVLDKYRKHLPVGTLLRIRGQVETMQSSFVRLGLGMLFAILLVYLLMVVNFQSWVDPFIILMAIPGAFSGILWTLFLTGTTLNVPSLMGCIMAIGVATANSILLVTFANDERVEGKSAIESALSAGYTRLRPVLMTALAMILGMLPMSLALGEGGEQNAPLGRAVIGGLIIATVSTLFFVPVVYSYLRKAAPVDKDRQIEAEWAEGESIPGVGEF
ncbi:MAG TPA: efflux RND transporter permease subunit [Bryobacteraceae bacterium]|nr:efflux RND transporter permease subunit [Bryobacteraceae bacterium]